MKKWIVMLVVIGMVGWAIFDYVNSNEKSADSFESVEEVQENGEVENNVETENEEMENIEHEETDAKEKPLIGLEKGNIAPDFELETLTGDVVKLSDFRGEQVMVNFWATWCPPCRAEMPDMEKFYRDKDVEILAVNLTETEASVEDIEQFSEEFDLTFPILMDANLDVATQFAIQPIPTSYLVDSNGVIQNVAYGPLNYDLMVQEFDKME